MPVEFPAEVWSTIAAALGNHDGGFVERCRLTSVCSEMRVAGASLPIANEVCSVDIGQMVLYCPSVAQKYMLAFDVVTERIVRIAMNNTLLRLVKDPVPSARLYDVEKRIVWSPRRSLVRLTVEHYDSGRHDSLLYRSLESFQKMTAADKALASSGKIETLGQRTQTKSTWQTELQQALDRVGDSVPENGMHTLAIKNIISSGPLKVQRLVAGLNKCRTVLKLSLVNVKITPAAVIELADFARRLQVLELNNCTHFQSRDQSPTIRLACCALGDLLRCWKALPPINDHGLRCLILDNTEIGYLVDIVSGAFMPEGAEIEAVSQNSYATNAVYIACNAVNAHTWEESIRAAATRPIASPPVVRLVANQGYQSVVPPPKKKVKTPPLPPPLPNQFFSEQVLHPAFALLPTGYADEKRERDRYMWQWFPYTCKSCGIIWKEHTVTISWRQTCVSECLKGKKKCANRPEYERMLAGESFITEQSATGLTPDPEDVKAVAAEGKLVAIHPRHGRQLFTPSESKADGKVYFGPG